VIYEAFETADQTQFRLCLEQSIDKYKPTVAAEEYSDDALARASLRAPQEFSIPRENALPVHRKSIHHRSESSKVCRQENLCRKFANDLTRLCLTTVILSK
jgi:hypothetical protein